MATVAITAEDIRDANGQPDNRPWSAYSPTYREGGDGGIITPVMGQPQRPVGGKLTLHLEPGPAVIRNPDGKSYLVTVPSSPADLWDVIEAAVAFPPETSAELLASVVSQYLDDNPPAADWNGLENKPSVIGAGDNAAAARAAIGAGTASTKADVGLGYASNTADADKPVSGPQAAALASQASVKRGDPWWNTVFAAPADTPTITVASASQISGGATVTPTADYDTDPYFRYDGCTSVQANSGTALVLGTADVGWSSELVPLPETITDAQDMEFVFRSGRTGTQVIGVRVIVDGKLSSIPMQRFDATSGTDYFYRVQFSSAKVRQIKFEISGANLLRSMITGAKTVHRRPEGPYKFRFVAIGDSLNAGGPNMHIGAEQSGDLFYFNRESHGYYQAMLMGCDSYIGLAAGGTGWSDVYPTNKFSHRISLALSAYPHVVGFFGSRNDTGRESQVLPAVMAALDRVKDVPAVVVCGPQQAGYTTLNELVRQGVVAAGRKWLNLDGVMASPASNVTGHPTKQEQLDTAKAAHAQIDAPRLMARIDAVNMGLAPVVTVTTSPAVSVGASTSATVTATIVPAIPGKVTFYDGTTKLSTVTLVNGTASLAATTYSLGSHSFTARFTPTNPLIARAVTSPATALTVTSTAGFADDFNRADGAIGTSSSGKVWSTSNTGFVVQSNTAGNPSASSTRYAYLDAETPNGVYTVRMKGTFNANAGILLRFQDLTSLFNLNFTGAGGSNPKLTSVVSNVVTTTVTGTGGPWVDGDIIEITLNGSSITVKKNGTTVLTATASELTTATKFGIVATSTSTTSFFDDVSFVPA